MRKLGIKNIRLFVLLAILVFVILLIFFFGIRYVLNLDTSTYTLQKGSFLYDDDFNYIEVEDDAILKKSFDNAFYLTMLTDGISQKYKIGPSTVVYNDADYKMYLYGTFYQVSTSGEVQKLTKMTEVVKANVPQFYKIADRKYLWIDSTFTSTSGLNTDEYLIIELDKQGNATLANHEMYEKTINPMVIKGSLYDFDVVHEKLILTDREIDLKNIIGSSNEYQDPVEEEEEEVSEEALPTGFGYEFSGMTREEAELSDSNTTTIVYVICVVFIYLILCGMYESLFLPLAVLCSVPFGLMGSYLFTKMWGLENNIYTQVGMVMLIGLLSKTAILITEYGSQRRKRGMSLSAAALSAAGVRLRPVLMTVLTMVIGLLPLITASGVGANGYRSLGVGTAGGMVVGTIALMFLTPMFFVIFQYVEEKVMGKRKEERASL